MPRILAALVLLLSYPAAAAETVIWLTTDLPPQYIGEGKFAGLGIKDQQLRLILGELKEYDHREIQASIGRLWYEMQREDGVCGLGVLRSPEREKIAVFTERPVPVPGFRLIIKTDHLDAFRPFMTGEDEIDLAALKKNHRLTGGYVVDRVYPAQMMEFITDPEHQSRLERSVGSERLYQLLRSNRVDFVLGLGYEARYFDKLQDDYAPLTALTVKGTDRLIKGYTACSDRPLGREVIARIDALQREDSFWRQWVAPLQRWLNPADFAALRGQE